jgi:DNA-binding response OmpR family regulator
MSILIVEDDADLLDILCFTLRREGHEVIAARDGAVGLQLWRQKDPQLVLLDVDLPKVNGWEVCRQIRAESNTPILMLTAARSDADIVRGLDSGADDYITKPFNPRELLARIRAVLRRAKEAADQPRKGWQVITAGDLKLDPQWRSVYIGDRAIRLTGIEFKLLYELVLHEGQVLTHQILTDRVWGYEGVDDGSLLKGHIRNLRRKLDDDSNNPTYIHTVPGIGYTFRRRQPVSA